MLLDTAIKERISNLACSQTVFFNCLPQMKPGSPLLTMLPSHHFSAVALFSHALYTTSHRRTISSVFKSLIILWRFYLLVQSLFLIRITLVLALDIINIHIDIVWPLFPQLFSSVDQLPHFHGPASTLMLSLPISALFLWSDFQQFQSWVFSTYFF